MIANYILRLHVQYNIVVDLFVFAPFCFSNCLLPFFDAFQSVE